MFPGPFTVFHTFAINVNVDVFEELVDKEASTIEAHVVADDPCDRGEPSSVVLTLKAEYILLLQSHHRLSENLANERVWSQARSEVGLDEVGIESICPAIGKQVSPFLVPCSAGGCLNYVDFSGKPVSPSCGVQKEGDEFSNGCQTT